MTARANVARARGYLAVSVALAAAGWAVAGALLTGAVLAAATAVTRAPIPGWIAALPAIVAVIAAGVVLYRAWPGRSLERVALWIEEQRPELSFAVVTASDPALVATPALERAASFQPAHVVRGPASKMVIVASVAASLSAAAVWALAGPNAAGEILAGRSAAAVSGSGAIVDPLKGMRAIVVPPSYSRARSITIDEPSAVAALRGSIITVTGRGTGVTGFLGATRLRSAVGREWKFQVEMPGTPVALTMRHGDRQRVIVLEPRADTPPRVRLTSPARDTIMPRASGSVRVAAAVEDDLGLFDGYIEYMLSSGAEETFAARTVVTAVRAFGGSSRGDLSAVIDLGALNMGPGDLISIRAVARDGNNVSGRGVGVSDTRTFRVARRDEYDSLAIEAGAPIVPESTVVSQRMLILRTEALLREQPVLARDSMLARVRGIATDQIRLRERVHDLIYPAHTHAEGEIEAQGEPEDVEEGGAPVNPNLKTAYEEMWSASRELQIAEPATALPFMRAAAAALDRARLANRYYLRSRPSRVVVDVPRARLQGKDKGSSATRTPHEAMTARREIALSFASAIARRDPSAAANELSLVRVRALADLPDFAAALEPVIDALRRGRDPRSAVASARRELDRAEEGVRDPASWSRW